MLYYVYMPLGGPFNLDQYNLILFWENQPRKYNYSHEIVINTTGHDLNITSLDEELTEEASCGDLQSEEDL